jgi:hypothetical protein
MTPRNRPLPEVSLIDHEILARMRYVPADTASTAVKALHTTVVHYLEGTDTAREAAIRMKVHASTITMACDALRQNDPVVLAALLDDGLTLSAFKKQIERVHNLEDRHRLIAQLQEADRRTDGTRMGARTGRNIKGSVRLRPAPQGMERLLKNIVDSLAVLLNMAEESIAPADAAPLACLSRQAAHDLRRLDRRLLYYSVQDRIQTTARGGPNGKG